MTTRSKTTFIILGTLIIGIVVGSLGSGMLRERRVEKFDRMRPQQRFVEVMENIIKPDKAQREEIEKVLEKRFEHIAQIRERHELEMMSAFDSLRVELNALLTAEQLKRLEDHFEKGSQKFIKRKLDRLTDVLKLSEDQRKQIEEIYRRYEPGFMGFRRSAPADSGRSRPEVSGRREKLDEEIEKVLTPAQRDKYRQFRERRERRDFPLGSPPPAPFGEPPRPPEERD